MPTLLSHRRSSPQWGKSSSLVGLSDRERATSPPSCPLPFGTLRLGMQRLLGSGIYPLRQAARLVGQEPRTVRRWLKGYSWKYLNGRSYSGPLWHTQYEDEDLPGERVISFRDLLELRMVAEFAKHGVHLKVIRATIETASADFCSAYPLSDRKFLTDGKRIFMEAVEQTTGHDKLLDVVGRQFVFSNVIRESLFAGIDYDNGNAARWFPEKNARSYSTPKCSSARRFLPTWLFPPMPFTTLGAPKPRIARRWPASFALHPPWSMQRLASSSAFRVELLLR